MASEGESSGNADSHTGSALDQAGLARRLLQRRTESGCRGPAVRPRTTVERRSDRARQLSGTWPEASLQLLESVANLLPSGLILRVGLHVSEALLEDRDVRIRDRKSVGIALDAIPEGFSKLDSLRCGKFQRFCEERGVHADDSTARFWRSPPVPATDTGTCVTRRARTSRGGAGRAAARSYPLPCEKCWPARPVRIPGVALRRVIQKSK